VKLHRIGIDYNVKWDACFDGWSNSEHRAEFADSHFSHHVFDFLSVYVSPLHLRHKLLCGNALFQNDAKFPFTFYLTSNYCFDMQIQHFDIYAKFTDAHSVLGHHSGVTNIEQVHCDAGDSSFRHSDYAMEAQILS
jgi:hypothetical protein